MRIYKSLLVLMLALSQDYTSLFAEIDEGRQTVEVEVTNGYRIDKISSKTKVYDPPHQLILIDKLDIDNISMYQLAVKGNWQGCDPFIGWGDLYFSIDGDYAWAYCGSYHEKNVVPAGMTLYTKAYVRNGNAQDLTLTGGYLFDFNHCCGLVPKGFVIGPIAGWSRNKQKMKMKNAMTNGVSNPVLDDLAYSNTWQGPWLGFDATYSVSEFEINLAYEYHWANWHARWDLNQSNVTGSAFSDKRKSNDAYGQVMWLNGCWKTGPGWSLGLGIKYQTWDATHGQSKPSGTNFAGVGLSNTEIDKISHAGWNSFAATVNLGYVF